MKGRWLGAAAVGVVAAVAGWWFVRPGPTEVDRTSATPGASRPGELDAAATGADPGAPRTATGSSLPERLQAAGEARSRGDTVEAERLYALAVQEMEALDPDDPRLWDALARLARARRGRGVHPTRPGPRSGGC